MTITKKQTKIKHQTELNLKDIPRYARNVNEHIGALGSKVEEQLNEINKKCSELQKQENRVRKCLKKLSAGNGSKKDTDDESQRTASSNERERRNKKSSNHNHASTSENDYARNIDRIISNVMNDSESIQRIKKSSKSMDANDRDVIDVDAICRIDEGI